MKHNHQDPRRIGFDARGFIAAVEGVARMRGMTLSGMALHIGVQYATCSRMKRHGRQPDAASLCAMARWSGLNPAEFATDTEQAA
jgi:diaminopimelate decarboxylase